MIPAPTDSDILDRLAAMLADPKMPVQQVVAAAAGVPQGLVSMAANRRLRRVTSRVRRLIEYSDNLLGLASEVAAARPAKGPIAVDGFDAHVPARDGESAAEEELRHYLRDGYDPSVVIAQLYVLRRAQQVRAPGRRVR